jgi:hypothetical protein
MSAPRNGGVTPSGHSGPVTESIRAQDRSQQEFDWRGGRSRLAARLAWALLGVGVIAAMVGTWLAWAVSHINLPPGEAGLPMILLWTMLAFVGVGSLLAARRPDNPIGWLLAVVGLSWQADVVVGDLRTHALLVRPGTPGGVVSAVLFDVLWVVPFILLFIVMLVFPDGRLVSGRWWPAPVALGAAGILMILSVGLHPGPLPTTSWVDNPFGVPGMEGMGGAMESVATLLIVGGALAGLASVTVRYRRGDAIARRQLAWLIFAIGVVIASLTAATVLSARGVGDPYVAVLNVGPLLLIPVAVGVAITRHRLYEIDRIVSRTVTYSVVVVVLGLAYAGLVVVLRGLFPAEGDLPVALTTLALASAFLPLAKAVQRWVDRRFFRSRYDSGLVVASFADDLRSSLDLADMTDRARNLIDGVFAPEAVAVWIENDSQPSGVVR